MGIDLREYQLELKGAIRLAIKEGYKRIIAQCPTGGGKTVVAADILAAVERGDKNGLFLLPRRELVYQSAEKLFKFNIYPGIVMAGERMDPSKKTQLASFDTLHARAMRTEKMELPKADFVLVDECHLSVAETRKAIIEAYPDAIVIGFTATPARSDGKALGDLYDKLILSWPTQRMVDEGYLVDARYFAPSVPDLHKIKINPETGDYQEKALGKAMDKPKLIGEIVDNWLRIAPDRRTVVFCVTKSHARHTCEEFNRRGIKAEYVDDQTPNKDRKRIFANVMHGRTQVLVNVFVATFGLDIPPLSCVVIARPTKSLVLYHQIGGRGLRPVYLDGMPLTTAEERIISIACSMKPDCIIIDHAGVVLNHGRLTDPVPWALTYDGRIETKKRAAEEEKQAPKEMRCENCDTVFSGVRFCPNCGHQMIASGKPVPTYKAELIEVFPNDGTKANQKTPMAEKMEFYGQALGYEKEKGFKKGFAANKFKAKFGVYPNAPELHDVIPNGRRTLIHGWLAHEGMKRRYTK